MNINTLYLPLSKKELPLACVLSLVFLVAGLCLVNISYWLFCLLTLVIAGVLAFTMRDFLSQTGYNLTLFGKGVWLKPLLAFVLNLVITTVFNDLALFYNLPYFVTTGWGPTLYDIRAAVLSDYQNLWLITLFVVILLPAVEEFIFRQTVFSLIFPKSRFFATFLSIALFATFHVLPYIGMMDSVYLAIYAFQFIPMGIFLCWLYTSTDSLAAPTLMHMLCNILVMRAAWNYSFMM